MYDLQKNKNFLKTLISYTKDGKIIWDYLDAEPLDQDVIDKIEYLLPIDYDVIDFENSFYYADKQSNTYALVRTLSSNYYFFLIPYTLKSTQSLCDNEYTQLIVELSNIIQSKLPSAQQMIDNILNM
ncbi:MAG: hypothetical protein E6590_13425 [Clostridiales bacterium]|uniref:hypothetical protein n=1 Tax=Zhenhengia sp. TaxID=2944208 RepID=UPI0029077E3F|nr:hypothetical protein [Clostridiales bacterium]